MKPILFNTEMVRAILEGRKTVTRRVVKAPYYIEDPEVSRVSGLAMHKGTNITDGMPYPDRPYRPGDILYVRETWGLYHQEPFFYVYKADSTPGDEFDTDPEWKWRPSIHMPKEAARIFLRVADVRVERLLEITAEQAQAEGVRYTDFGMYQPSWKASLDGGKTFHPAKAIHHPGYHIKNVAGPEQCYPTARGAFANLWDSTIKPADLPRYGWAANPWVWVIEFERCEKPERGRE